MRLVFFGTPDFAVPCLRALLDGPDEVVGVVCQPDRPAGRGQKLAAPPVKVLALEAGLPVVQPERLRNNDEFLAQLREWAPEVAIVVAYGRILPPSVLDLPPHGCINVHASLLPKYRGAAPIQWSIYHGDPVTGVTIMRINERMDAGDILLQVETSIGVEETYGELQTRLSEIGATALVDALERLRGGGLEGRAQDEALVTYAPMINKEQGRIDWTSSAKQLAFAARAFHPWPTVFTSLEGRRLQIHRAVALDARASDAPGTVVAVGDDIRVSTGDGLFVIQELQLEGRKRMPAADFVRGGLIQRGSVLG